MSKSVLITGADGFLGTQLCREFARQGWSVHGLVRNAGGKRLPAALSSCHEYTLETGPSDEAKRLAADVVIHNAYQTSSVSTAASGEVNRASARLLAQHYGGALFVFISSMSAHDNAYSVYGRSKRAIETDLNLAESIVVRPGFVIGPGGIFRRLAQTLSRSPIVPMPYGGDLPIQTVDVAELGRAVAELVAMRATGLWNFGEPTSIRIADFYTAIARWAGHRPRLVPVPGAPVLQLVRLMERFGVRLPLNSENLLGLKGLIHQPVEPAIARLGWQPSALPEILNRYDAKNVLER